LASALDRFVAALFGGGRAQKGDDPALLAALAEAVVDVVEPKVKLASGYQRKLGGSIQATIDHLRGLAPLLGEPLVMARSAWMEDARLNAFFATAGDLVSCIGRSKELRKLFAATDAAAVPEAYALLAMTKEQHTVLAPAFVDGQLRQDVPQVTVSFSNQRLLGATPTEKEARMELGRRIIYRLGQVALTRVVALSDKSVQLQEHKAYLAARLKILALARDGMEGIVEDAATIESKINEAQKELKDTVDQYIDVKSSLATLDDYIAQIKEVFGNPAQHVTLTRETIRLTRLGVKVPENSTEPANSVVLTEIAIGTRIRGVIALARCSRAEMPPEEDLVAKAARYL